MCGIAGFADSHMNIEERRDTVTAMNERMLNRGPDAGDYYIDNDRGVTFGHRRLSIRDLSDAGTQPMISADGRYVMVYNGEIYNAEKLKTMLEDDRHVIKWRGSSDTEILLEAIAAYGIHRTLRLSKGMFGIAVYDRDTGDVSIARDRVGEKPLYYGHVRGDFIFASDIDAIRAYPGFDNEIDKDALKLYLRYSFIPAPYSIYCGIYKLKPGSIMTFKYPYDKGLESVYYDLHAEYSYGKTDGRFKGEFADAVDELEHALKGAVRGQLLSDVPLGAFLSGGIDSSTVVALMQSVADAPVKTFTIGFEQKEYDESEAAGAIGKHLGTEHTCLTISEDELMDVIPKLSDIFTEPFADSSQIPTYLVSRLARSRVTVSLSGDAGDELFAGYNTYYKVADLYNRLRGFPLAARNFAGNISRKSSNNDLYRTANCLLAKDIANLHEAVCYDMTNMAPEHIKQDMLLGGEIENGMAAPEDEMMLRDLLRYHPDDILVKVDRAGMAVSLENRVPMLDADVIKLAFSLPVDR